MNLPDLGTTHVQAYKNAQEAPAHLGLGQPVKNVLVIIPGYAGETSHIGEGSTWLSAAGWLWRVLTTANFRSFVKQYRDFYANPRSSTYMAEAVGELLGKTMPDAQVTLSSPAQDDFSTPWAARRLPLTPAPADYGNLAKPHGPFDAVILAHHDALGLGLYPLEQALLAQFKDVFVINGRRRVYRLDQSAQTEHKLRRFLAQTRLAELLMSYRIDLLTFFAKWSNQPGKS